MNETWLAHHGIPGMRWGIRRYQNKDGTYTEAGARRYSKEATLDNRKRPGDRYTREQLGDVDRWVQHDRTYAKQAAEQARNMTNSMKELERATNKPKEKPRLDLSNMTDKELRDRVNRELLERQYNQVFNAPETSKGREYVREALDIAGSTLGITASALGIALAIQQLKRGG